MRRALPLLIFWLLVLSVQAVAMNLSVRPPAVAGAFYPADPRELQGQIRSLLSAAPDFQIPVGERLRALFVPHAGYVYSGPVAACAYRLLQSVRPQRVILLSPCHRQPLRGVDLDPRIQRTPLGDPRTDSELAAELRQALAGEGFVERGNAADGEHALEVQVPFLQFALGDFRLLPVLVGLHDLAGLRRLGNTLAEVLRRHPEALLIVSTDMSHFHPADRAEAMDAQTNRAIDELDFDRLVRRLDAGESELCGQFPVLAALYALRQLGVRRGQLLRYAHSGDMSGDRARVVGYSAHAFAIPQEDGNTAQDLAPAETKPEGFSLTREEEREILTLARQTLESWVREGKIPPCPFDRPRYKIRCGAFVTLKVQGELRGCIGMIEGQCPLTETIQEMTVSAASRDPRFSPVTARELAGIRLEISVLSPLESCQDPQEIEVGRHGLIIRQGSRSGLLLPQVATEWGWDREQFLAQTCRKAGLPADAWRHGASIQIFTAQVFGEDQ